MIGIIGGSGLLSIEGFERRSEVNEASAQTPWGEASAAPVLGEWKGASVVFLPRHGNPHRIPPHAVNYRANLWALREAGAKAVIAINTVGGIHPDCGAGRLVVVDDLIDYTWGRAHSYHDGISGTLEHIEFSEPYDASLRRQLLSAANAIGIDCRDGGVYAATQGPRLETPAEIRRLQRDGCDVVGMTGMPEAALARELNLPYACLCLVVNPAAGLSDEPITMEAIHAVQREGLAKVLAILERFLVQQGKPLLA